MKTRLLWLILLMISAFASIAAPKRALSAFPEAYDDASRIPAPPAVQNVLANHCIICHSDTSRMFASLDMSRWVMTPDGVMGFIQLNEDTRAQRRSAGTFSAMLFRITTPDKELHMPLGYALKSPNEFEPLKAWLEEQLALPRTLPVSP